MKKDLASLITYHVLFTNCVLLRHCFICFCLINFFLLFDLCFFFLCKSKTIKETEKSHLRDKFFFFSSFLPHFCFLHSRLSSKQYYKSNSTAVNRLQDWFSSTLSHRGCHIINTDLYHSLATHIHRCQYAAFVCSPAGKNTLNNIGCFYEHF